MNMSSEILAVLCSLFVMSTTALPLSEGPGHWTSPCGPSNGPATDINHVNITIANVLSALISQTMTAAQQTEQVQQIYKDRIGSTEFLKQLENVELKGLETGHVNEDSIFGTSDNLTAVFLDDYEQMSIMAVFWEKLIEDERHYEYWVDEKISNAEYRLYDVLCSLYTGIYQVLHSHIPSHVSRSVMDDKYRNLMNRSHRQARDYIIARDSTKILSFLSKRYEDISSNHE